MATDVIQSFVSNIKNDASSGVDLVATVDAISGDSNCPAGKTGRRRTQSRADEPFSRPR